MYNNDVTYDAKWETPENKAALALLEKKYFDKSECSPSCPVSWAPEVLAMMDELHELFGFRHNEKTLRGYYVRGNVVDWFIKDPWSAFFSSFNSNVFGKPTDYLGKNPDGSKSKVRRSVWSRIKHIASAVAHPIKYGIRASKVVYINPRLNRFQRNLITLGQLKEKYGSLTCYFHSPVGEAVDEIVRKCEIKLAMKGAYYPLESFYDAGTRYDVGNEYRPDVITSVTNPDGTITVTETKYRAAMQSLGVDLKDVAEKSAALKAQKANKV